MFITIKKENINKIKYVVYSSLFITIDIICTDYNKLQCRYAHDSDF